MLTSVAVDTLSLTLHVELQYGRDRSLAPLDIANQLTAAGFASGIAALQMAEDEYANEFAALRLQPTLIRAQFGSPLFFDLSLPGSLAEHALAFTFLLYAFKRLWGLPIELRTHRERLWKEFYDAREAAALAGERARELGTRQRHRLDNEMGWRPGSSTLLEEKKASTQGWEGSNGDLSAGD